MAVTCGFYNALNHDRKYNAEELSRIFDGVIRDGVYMTIGDKFAVTQSSGITVNVGTGRAWFNHTWTNNDADLPVKMEESELVLDRIDAIVIEVNASEEVRNNTIKAVKGTPSSQPTKPVMVETEFIHQHPLAYVTRKHGSTTITNSDIEIAVGKSECPYVTSILEAADISELFAQWDSQFNDWKNAQEASFESWSEDEKNEYQTWSETQKAMFIAWFDGIKGQLSEDAAGNLQLQINDKGIQVYTHSRSGNVNNFQGTGPNGRALMTADIQTGDTFTVNGSPVTAYMGADLAVDAMAGSAYNGKWVTFVFQDGILNFKGGGGAVTVTGLDAAAVKTGTTIVVKQGAKELQRVVGTFTDDATAYAGNILSGAVAYTRGQRIVGTIPIRTDIYEAPLAGQDPNKGAYGILGSNVWVVPAVGYYPNFAMQTSRIDIHGPSLANAAGLTPNILASGKTVLGVTGTLTWSDLLPPDTVLYPPLSALIGTFHKSAGVSIGSHSVTDLGSAIDFNIITTPGYPYVIFASSLPVPLTNFNYIEFTCDSTWPTTAISVGLSQDKINFVRNVGVDVGSASQVRSIDVTDLNGNCYITIRLDILLTNAETTRQTHFYIRKLRLVKR